MIDYPEGYPLPNAGTYSGVTDWGLLVSQVPGTLLNIGRGYNSARVDMTLSFDVNNVDYGQWLSWCRTFAYDWFAMPVVSPRTPTDITSVQRTRFISQIVYTKSGDDWGTATVSAELVPGDAL